LEGDFQQEVGIIDSRRKQFERVIVALDKAGKSTEKILSVG